MSHAPEIIPATLQEAFDAFASGNDAATIADIRTLDELEFVALAHHGMGRGIRNAWFLWWSPEAAQANPGSGYPVEAPPLVAWLTQLGLTHGDDRSSLLLRAWHRELTGKAHNLEEMVAEYQAHWAQWDNS
jgi:hypothetical protein